MPRPISSPNPFRRGKPLTRKNVMRDVEESFYDLKDEPQEFEKRINARWRDYQDSGGPNINQPVPLTDDPYKQMKRGLKYIRPKGK